MNDTPPYILVLATRNKDKIREIKHALSGMPYLVRALDEYDNVPEIIEDRSTIQENAIKKARTVAHITGEMTLADDTGLEVEYLDGAPGVYSSRYAGENASYAENVNKLLTNLQGVDRSKRKARFVTVMAFINGDQIRTAVGEINGLISEKPYGDGGFGYDPIFYVPEFKKTFAEMSIELKNKISHRGKALKKIQDLLKNI